MERIGLGKVFQLTERGAANRPPRQPKPPPLLAAVTVLACLAMLFVGCGSGEGGPAEYRPIIFTPLTDTGKKMIPSSEQQEALDQRGLPDHFWISLEPRSKDRVEYWTWMGRGEELVFHNGRLIRRREVADESDSYPPTPLKPQDFSTGTDLPDLEEMLGKPYFSTTSELGEKEMLLLFYPGAVATFTNGSFSSIDTKVHPFEKLPLEETIP